HIYFCKPLFSYFFSMENAAIRGGRYRWILNFVRENIASERDFIPIDDFYVSVRRFQTGFAGFGMLAYGHENFIVGVVKRNRHDLTVRGEGFHFHCLCLLFRIVFRLHHHNNTDICICKPPFRIFFRIKTKKVPAERRGYVKPFRIARRPKGPLRKSRREYTRRGAQFPTERLARLAASRKTRGWPAGSQSERGSSRSR